MKRVIFLLTVILAVAIAASAQANALVKSADNFSLPDTSGKMHSLDSLKGKNGSVVIFMSAQCPVVRAYNDRINQIATDYAAKGINFIGVNSNVTETAELVKTHAALTYKFPMLIDKGNLLADKFGASVTPEVYFLDAENILIYHGAIDSDRTGKGIGEQYLLTAFDASLNGAKLERTSAKAFGCGIKRTGD